MTESGEGIRFDWRRGGAAAAAFIAMLILLAMVFLVAASNDARDEALKKERHGYDVTLLTRSVDASIARSEAALGRFALDERPRTPATSTTINGTWPAGRSRNSSGCCETSPSSSGGSTSFRRFYDSSAPSSPTSRGSSRPAAAITASAIIIRRPSRRRARSLAQLRAKLREIADSERADLQQQIQETRYSRPAPTSSPTT